MEKYNKEGREAGFGQQNFISGSAGSGGGNKRFRPNENRPFENRPFRGGGGGGGGIGSGSGGGGTGGGGGFRGPRGGMFVFLKRQFFYFSRNNLKKCTCTFGAIFLVVLSY